MNLHGVHFIEEITASVQQNTNASADYGKETAVQKNATEQF